MEVRTEEFRTFKQYIQDMDIKEDTKKKYLKNLEEGGGNYCICTVINHFNKYIMGYATIIESHVKKPKTDWPEFRTAEEMIREAREMLDILDRHLNINREKKEREGR